MNVPHSLEAEQGLLCSCAIDAIYVMPLIRSASITKDHFYHENHKIFYQSLMDLWDNNLPMEFITIVRNLECNDLLDRVGGRPAVSKLLTFIPTAGHASVYIDHLMEDYNKRMLLSLYHQGINSILEPGACVKSCLHYSIDKLNDVIKYDVPDQSYHNQISNTMTDVEERIKNKAPIGISTGFKNLDHIIGGLEPDNLYIIGARPGSGKTAMLANIITHICSLNKQCAFFSLEMSHRQIINRMASAHSFVPLKDIKEGNLTTSQLDRLTKTFHKLSTFPLKIIDPPAMTLSELKTYARILHKKHNLAFIGVDYLQRINCKNKNGNLTEEINEVAKGLKVLARELKIPIIALAQLNRDSSKGNRTPNLHDLKQSSQIEQEADFVGFLFRDEDDEDDDNPIKDIKLLIRKQRDGETGSIYFSFNGPLTLFQEKT